MITLNTVFLSNTLRLYLYSLILFIVYLTVLYILRHYVFKKLEELSLKTETDLDDLLVKLIKRIKNPEYQLIAFYFAIRHLDRHTNFDYALRIVLIVVFTYRAITILKELTNYSINKIQKKVEDVPALESVKIISDIIIWIIGILFILHNLGFKIGAILTSLGIGGVAIALASQNILGDIFNFFVILFDKPFRKGDFVVISNISGVVEEIGLKSTKVRALSGELVTITNTKVFSDIIQNYAKMKERRVVGKIGVIYETEEKKLKLIGDIIKKSIEKRPNTRFDRANLVNFGNFSIDFEFVYYITNPDYNLYILTQEKIFNDIFEAFKNEGIEFAYPTQKIYLDK